MITLFIFLFLISACSFQHIFQLHQLKILPFQSPSSKVTLRLHYNPHKLPLKTSLQIKYNFHENKRLLKLNEIIIQKISLSPVPMISSELCSYFEEGSKKFNSNDSCSKCEEIRSKLEEEKTKLNQDRLALDTKQNEFRDERAKFDAEKKKFAEDSRLLKIDQDKIKNERSELRKETIELENNRLDVDNLINGYSQSHNNLLKLIKDQENDRLQLQKLKDNVNRKAEKLDKQEKEFKNYHDRMKKMISDQFQEIQASLKTAKQKFEESINIALYWKG